MTTTMQSPLSPELRAMFVRYEAEMVDPDFCGHHRPLVRQFDAPLRDGRRPVDRRQRLVGGLIDLATSVAPLAAAAAAGVNAVLLVVAHLLVTVVPTTMFGFTFGKWVVGTRVVDPETLEAPGLGRSIARWALSFAPIAAAFGLGLPADGAVLLCGVVYSMVAIDLRGLHDRLGRTVVVGRA